MKTENETVFLVFALAYIILLIVAYCLKGDNQDMHDISWKKLTLKSFSILVVRVNLIDFLLVCA